jgi:hypothetical protein
MVRPPLHLAEYGEVEKVGEIFANTIEIILTVTTVYAWETLETAGGQGACEVSISRRINRGEREEVVHA